MHIYILTHAYTYIHIYIYIYIHVYIYVNIYLHIHIYMCVHTYTYIHLHVYHLYIYIYLSFVYVCIPAQKMGEKKHQNLHSTVKLRSSGTLLRLIFEINKSMQTCIVESDSFEYMKSFFECLQGSFDCI